MKQRTMLPFCRTLVALGLLALVGTISCASERVVKELPETWQCGAFFSAEDVAAIGLHDPNYDESLEGDSTEGLTCTAMNEGDILTYGLTLKIYPAIHYAEFVKNIDRGWPSPGGFDGPLLGKRTQWSFITQVHVVFVAFLSNDERYAVQLIGNDDGPVTKDILEQVGRTVLAHIDAQ